ncbi:MAG TPA: hypothetical protein VGA84_08765 [Thermoanaerobaculia bacterium]
MSQRSRRVIWITGPVRLEPSHGIAVVFDASLGTVTGERASRSAVGPAEKQV